MEKTWQFEREEEFLARLQELRSQGVPPERIEVALPLPVPEAEKLLEIKPSPLRFFTLAGAVTGAAAGLAFILYTVKSWPLVTGGKPLISIPPFIVVMFACTILLGALASLFGFLHLTRMPTPKGIREPLEHENYFVIRVREEA
ncbi:MAG: DUF3341 domain-containing protein [Thermoleophilia bacterium]|nr:DUF3341 domain-containing protein [Thermoleophilia bacterium]